MKFRVAFVSVLLLVIVSLQAIAQERGQYIPGTDGLNSGLQTPEGVTLVVAIGTRVSSKG